MPHISSVYRCLEADPSFREAFASARELQSHWYADRISEIAEETLEGKHDPQAARVAMQGLMWRARVLNPSQYGEKKAHTHEVRFDPDQLLQLQRARAERLAGEGVRVIEHQSEAIALGLADEV